MEAKLLQNQLSTSEIFNCWSLMLAVFRNAFGIQLVVFADKGVRINDYYSNLLSEARKKIRIRRNIPLFKLHDCSDSHLMTSREQIPTVEPSSLLTWLGSKWFLPKKHLWGHHLELPIELQKAVCLLILWHCNFSPFLIFGNSLIKKMTNVNEWHIEKWTVFCKINVCCSDNY